MACFELKTPLGVDKMRVFLIFVCLLASFSVADVMKLWEVKTMETSKGTFLYTLADASAGQISFHVAAGYKTICSARTPSCTYALGQASVANADLEKATGVRVIYRSRDGQSPSGTFTVDFSTVSSTSPLPSVCPAIFDPVCGTDEKTYSNACLALLAKTSVSYKGACRPVPSVIPCFSQGQSLGAVIPENANHRCCPGLVPKVPEGTVGTMGTCSLPAPTPMPTSRPTQTGCGTCGGKAPALCAGPKTTAVSCGPALTTGMQAVCLSEKTISSQGTCPTCPSGYQPKGSCSTEGYGFIKKQTCIRKTTTVCKEKLACLPDEKIVGSQSCVVSTQPQSQTCCTVPDVSPVPDAQNALVQTSAEPNDPQLTLYERGDILCPAKSTACILNSIAKPYDGRRILLSNPYRGVMNRKDQLVTPRGIRILLLQVRASFKDVIVCEPGKPCAQPNIRPIGPLASFEVYDEKNALLETFSLNAGGAYSKNGIVLKLLDSASSAAVIVDAIPATALPSSTPSPAPNFDTLMVSSGQRSFPTSSTDVKSVDCSYVTLVSSFVGPFDFSKGASPAKTNRFYVITASQKRGECQKGAVFYQDSSTGNFVKYLDPNAQTDDQGIRSNYVSYNLIPYGGSGNVLIGIYPANMKSDGSTGPINAINIPDIATGTKGGSFDLGVNQADSTSPFLGPSGYSTSGNNLLPAGSPCAAPQTHGTCERIQTGYVSPSGSVLASLSLTSAELKIALKSYAVSTPSPIPKPGFDLNTADKTCKTNADCRLVDYAQPLGCCMGCGPSDLGATSVVAVNAAWYDKLANGACRLQSLAKLECPLYPCTKPAGAEQPVCVKGTCIKITPPTEGEAR